MAPQPITRAEISRSRLTGNFLRLRSLAQRSSYSDRCDLLAVVKAEAYGHDVKLCAPWLVEAGATWLGVTSVEEGLAVRRLCPEVRILVMSGLQSSDAAKMLNAHLTPTVWDLAHLEILGSLAKQRSLASDSIPVHLEIDTGMSRQGVQGTELGDFLDRLRGIPALQLEGVFTHFASPEVLDAEENSQQLTCFQQAAEQIASAGFRPQWIHAGNSSTLLGQQQLVPLVALAKKFDANFLLRPGLSLYGYALPFVGGRDGRMPIELQPVMAWKTAVASLRTIEAGTRVGYNGTFVASRQMRLALLPVGYADGLNRKLSNRGHVLLGGAAAPIVGRISMDLTIVDVGDTPDAAVGDEAVILGEQNGQRITADDHARWAETIPYEILCAVGARVQRVAAD